MKLAINYSPQAETLVARGEIDFDLFKCPAPEPAITEAAPDLWNRAASLRPMYIHFPLNTDSSLANVDWNAIKSLRKSTNTPCVNLHLTGPTSELPDGRQETIVNGAVHWILEATSHLDANELIIENIPGGAGRRNWAGIADPAVITRVLEETGTGLLLDLAHARIACAHLGLDVRSYIDLLPTDRLREMHVTGASDHAGRIRDSMPMGPDDWDLLLWALKRIEDGDWAKPWVCALEYGGVTNLFDWRSDPAEILLQTHRLRALIK